MSEGNGDEPDYYYDLESSSSTLKPTQPAGKHANYATLVRPGVMITVR